MAVQGALRERGQPGELGLSPFTPKLPVAEERALVPGGFEAGGVAAGIKRSGRADLAVVRVVSGAAATAAVFTTNRVPAAPVRLSRRHLAAGAPEGAGRYGWTDGIVATSGCANAATGPAGDADQEHIAALLATALGTTPERTLAVSTGLIGTRLPLDAVAAGIAGLVPGGLGRSPAAVESAADALLTTDTHRKLASLELELPDADGGTAAVRVCGIAKGVGMIHPRMATMLAVLLTDAAADPTTLHGLLGPVVARTWNQLSVDGDTSTNDTVFLLASGASRAARVEPGTEGARALGDAIEAVARSLARQQAADGEGATTLLTCQVSGARDGAEARAVARAVVSSSLVKAALHGRDPNWGRIIAAAGNATLPDAAVLEAAGLGPEEAAARAGEAVPIDPDRLRIAVAGTLVFAGAPLPFDPQTVAPAMAQSEVLVRLDLGAGTGSGEAFGCDLTETYVRENSAYTT
jgi:glutamate N-acetyltransferase/amino-acid N-acetyltransferase